MNKIICGDNLEVLSNFEDESVDLVVTSPPYDSIRSYGGGWNIDLPALGKEIFRVLKDGRFACVVINDGTKDFKKSLTTFRLAIDWVDNASLNLFETVIYSRFGRPGAWWNKRFRVDHEYILLFFKGDRPSVFDKEPLKIPAIWGGSVFHGTQRMSDGSLEKIKKTEQKNLKCRGTIWKYSTSNTEGNKLKMQHPATFPDSLAGDLIKCFSLPNEIVLDPFCGSGTTCVEAKRLGRKYIGIDISPEYCEISEKRTLISF